jgi:hypothetical protein
MPTSDLEGHPARNKKIYKRKKIKETKRLVAAGGVREPEQSNKN